MTMPLNTQEWVSALVERYQAPLTRYARRLTNSEQLARDIVQDTFLRVCSQDPASIEPIAAAWLYRVCRNRAIDLLKKETRMKPLATNDTELPCSRIEDPARCAAQRDESQRALELLRSLTEQQQEVIRLKIEHGLRYREIADVTGLTETNIGFLIHTGLKKLRQAMD